MANTYSLDLESGSSQYASITDGSQTGLDLSSDFTAEAVIEDLTSRTIVEFIKDKKPNTHMLKVEKSSTDLIKNKRPKIFE